LRGRPQVLQLWYEFGSRLDFINDFKLSPTAKKFIWRAIYDHTKKLYNHSGDIPIRFLRAPSTSEISYAYMIGSMEWHFVNSAGNWTAWVEFLDSEVMRTDNRIIEWIKDLQVKTPLQGGFLRELNKAIRRRFSGVDTQSMDDSELIKILEHIFEKASTKRQ